MRDIEIQLKKIVMYVIIPLEYEVADFIDKNDDIPLPDWLTSLAKEKAENYVYEQDYRVRSVSEPVFNTLEWYSDGPQIWFEVEVEAR